MNQVEIRRPALEPAQRASPSQSPICRNEPLQHRPDQANGFCG